MPMGRLLRPTLAGALVLMALVPLGADAGAPLGDDLGSCSEPGQIVQRKDGWAEIKSPTYAGELGEGADVITASAVPQNRGWVYVTNGRILRLSVDAGREGELRLREGNRLPVDCGAAVDLIGEQGGA